MVPQLENEPEVAKNRAEPEKAPFEIPKKWKWYSLGEVIDYGKARQVGSSFVTDNTWVLDLEDIEKNTGRLLTKKRGLVSSSNKNIFKKGWVLYSKLRPYLNKVIIADEDGICTTEIVPINTNESKIPLLAGYLKAYLMSPYFLSYANQVAHGVKMPRIGTKDAKTALIPIPPIEEQSRIIQKLSNSFKQIQCASEAYNELNTLSKNLKQQVLLRAIQGRLVPQLGSEPEVSRIGISINNTPFHIPEKWQWCKLSDVVEIQNGDRGKNYPSKDKLTTNNTGLPFVSAVNLENLQISTKNLLYLQPEQNEKLRAGHIKAGDCLLCIRGSLGKFGFAAQSGGAIASSLVILRSKSDDIIFSKYLGIFLQSSFFAEQIKINQNGTAQPNLSAKDLSNFLVPIPPVTEQQRIVGKFEEIHDALTAI